MLPDGIEQTLQSAYLRPERETKMKQIVGINHVGIRVTDLTQSRNFYAQLGFEFLAGPIGPEPVAIMEHPSGVNITHSQCRFRRAQ